MAKKPAWKFEIFFDAIDDQEEADEADCLVVNNSSTAIYVSSSSSTGTHVTGCTIYGNYTGVSTSGSSARLYVNNCNITGNTYGGSRSTDHVDRAAKTRQRTPCGVRRQSRKNRYVIQPAPCTEMVTL